VRNVTRLLDKDLRSRSEARSEDLSVETLQAVRDWRLWLEATGVHPYNAWMTRQGKEAPHSFTWKLRRDLTVSERSLLAHKVLNGPYAHPGDVFCLVKNFIKDTALQQPPVLVMPRDRLNRLAPFPDRLDKLPEVSAERRAELRKLAGAVRAEMPRSAAYLESLANRQSMFAADLKPLTWLPQASEPELPLEPTRNPAFPNLPETSWELKVRFSRM